jgi:hypothetical protein
VFSLADIGNQDRGKSKSGNEGEEREERCKIVFIFLLIFIQSEPLKFVLPHVVYQ